MYTKEELKDMQRELCEDIVEPFWLFFSDIHPNGFTLIIPIEASILVTS